MVGKVFITRSGYDPEVGKHVKDPYLGPQPTLGACRPDIRKALNRGDHIFVISGKVSGVSQYIMAGFEVEKKISALEAYQMFPQHRLRKLDDGQVTGNIIVTEQGNQHRLDDHTNFERRIDNYIVGKGLVAPFSREAILVARAETMDMLREVLRKHGDTPIAIVGRSGAKLNEAQILCLREWLASISMN